MKKNPFSLYDFLGYVFPGILSLIIAYVLFHIKWESSNFSINEIKDVLKNLGKVLSWGDTIIFIIISYCLGHIIAYASSLTVEKISIWLYGYPSAFIMGNTCFFKRIRTKSYWKNFFQIEGSNKVLERFCEVIWKCLVCIYMFPVVICGFFLGYILQVEKLYLKPVDGTLKKIIESQTTKLMRLLGIEDKIDFTKSSSDYHRLIFNYEYEKQNAHQHKMDNYVAIYGFLRALTFISDSLFIVFVILLVGNIGHFCWFVPVIIGGFTYFLFMAYMKFYRRFTMESFMCLAIDTEISNIPSKPSRENSDNQ